MTPNTSAPPTMRLKSTGPSQPPAQSERIEELAIAAARAGKPLYDACPYPFNTEAGQHFTAIWFLHTNAADTLNPRPSPTI